MPASDSGGHIRQIVVLALGNLMHSDDGAGIHALHALRSKSAAHMDGFEASGIDVRWIEGGTLGLELTHYLAHADDLLVLDAVEMKRPPGTVALYSGDVLLKLPIGRSVHLLGLSDLMTAIRLLGNEPRDVVLVGIQPGSTEWGLQLSSEVQAGLPLLITTAEKQIQSWSNCSACPRLPLRVG
jgi:hydrogenase maturation protease